MLKKKLLYNTDVQTNMILMMSDGAILSLVMAPNWSDGANLWHLMTSDNGPLFHNK